VSRVKVTVLSDASASPLVSALLPAFVESAGIPVDDARRLSAVVQGFVSFTLDNAYPDDMQFQRNYQVRSGRETQYGPRPYYSYEPRPNPYYERRFDDGRGFFQPWGR